MRSELFIPVHSNNRVKKGCSRRIRAGRILLQRRPRRRNSLRSSHRQQQLFLQQLQQGVLSICINLSERPPLNSDHLHTATTCIQRPPFRDPILKFYNKKLPLNNDHCQQRPQIWGPKGVRCTQI